MTINEFMTTLRSTYDSIADNYEYIGLRWENKQRNVGDVCENSRHNPDRDDEREFPQYGTEAYYELPERDGTSAWNLGSKWFWGRLENDAQNNGDLDVHEYYIIGDHCYIVASNYVGCDGYDLDEDEILLRNAKVVAVIY